MTQTNDEINRISQVSTNNAFGGVHQQYSHQSAVLNCPMRFAIYLPPQASEQTPVPVLYWLSGLTCTDENFMQKAGALKLAATLGVAIVAPDTSPRGEGVADDENQAYDLGLGAGFYVNATQKPWSAHYRMYDYVVNELPAIIEANFAVNAKRAISGHSMGGHGALTIALKSSDKYASVSAFSPICQPSECPWGLKAFTAYLGDDKSTWLKYDATALITSAEQDKVLPILVEQGSDDQFLEEQLKPESLCAAAKEANIELTYNLREGYDHSYYFIASFIEQHLEFHARHLGLLE